MHLTIQNLSKQYRRGFWGLRDFDLDVKPGVIGLLGLVVWLVYLSATGALVMSVPRNSSGDGQHRDRALAIEIHGHRIRQTARSGLPVPGRVR
jgi:hypothetical protein